MLSMLSTRAHELKKEKGIWIFNSLFAHARRQRGQQSSYPSPRADPWL